jgi:putative Ca2+/H+ antiporter (TMEM165/GDT1 family)
VILEPFFVSTGVVALAEIGDKTQILSMCMAARFRRPLPIIAGILLATLLNHFVAGLAGTLVGELLHGPWMRWILGLSFLAVSAWALVPDTLDDAAAKSKGGWGAFGATAIAFFLAEIGDKTQIATIGLAARFGQFYPVVMGTTLGMILANIPVVAIGGRVASRLPVKAIRLVAAAVFALLGVLTIAGIGE